MRHGSVNRRPRGRGKGGQRGGQRMQVFDSNGPDVRIRGTAHQVAEKYEALAKDAASSGDRILAESYLQHAEHYQRTINAWAEQNGEQPQRNDRPSSKGSQENKKSEEDLSLPTSILGGDVQAERTPQGQGETADA